jgi:tetratricopeptide (TPR) repeat protein
LGHAAAQARAREDALTAVALLRRGAELTTPASVLRRDLLVRLADSLMECNKVDETRVVLDLIEAELDDAATDLDRAMLACQRLVTRLHQAEDLDPALLDEAAIRAVGLAREAGDDQRLAIALYARRHAIIVRATWSQLEELAADLARVGGTYQVRAARSWLGMTYFMGAWSMRSFLVYVEDELRATSSLRREAQLRLGRAVALAALNGPAARGEVDAAIAGAATEDPWERLDVAGHASTAAELMGDEEAALSWLDTAITIRREQGDLAFLSSDLAGKAALLLELGRPVEEVRPVVAEAQILTSGHDVASNAGLHVANCLIAAREGRHGVAADLAAQALKVIDGGETIWEQADVRRLVAEAALAGGHVPEARQLLTEALERYRLKEMLVATRRVEDQLADMSSGPPGRGLPHSKQKRARAGRTAPQSVQVGAEPASLAMT